MRTKLRIVFPSSPCTEDQLAKGLSDLKQAGFSTECKKPNVYPQLPFLSGSVEDRLSEFTEALFDKSIRFILCARGGYGASDLLDALPWGKLKSIEPKYIVGFSDISALHSAFFAKLGWVSVHAPMPGSRLWGKNGSQDLESLYELFRAPTEWSGSIRIKNIASQIDSSINGWLFGGCLSVLCSLVGTPYFPHSLRGAILLLEDTGETPGEVLRMINQLKHCGLLESASALVLGYFESLEDPDTLFQEIARRVSIPVLSSMDFGHLSPNFPWVLGAYGEIHGNELRWTYGGVK